jgi:hypothetical protein
MQRTLDVLKAKNNLKVTRVNFMGMSLGALEGAYLSLLDGAEDGSGSRGISSSTRPSTSPPSSSSSTSGIR